MNSILVLLIAEFAATQHDDYKKCDSLDDLKNLGVHIDRILEHCRKGLKAVVGSNW